MGNNHFPVIDTVATGTNIKRLFLERNLTVGDVQRHFGFESPRTVYNWTSGKSLPNIDNLYALSYLLDVTINEILVSKN